MSDGIYSAVSGAVVQGRALDHAAHNIANGSTTGFRATRLSFTEVLASKEGGRSLVDVGAETTDTTPGAIRSTGKALDLAIDGDGWFALDTPQGTRYTRAGDLHVDAAGTLVDAHGNAVRSAGGGTIGVPADGSEVSVSADGTVYAGEAEIGRIELVRIAAEGLRPVGENVFEAVGPVETIDPVAEGGGVLSGHLEGSNYDPVRGMVDLVRISRTHESLHHMIETYRELDRRTARELGGPK